MGFEIAKGHNIMLAEKWMCQICGKTNEQILLNCITCNRSREKSAVSFANDNIAKPHALHGENALYVRPEQVSWMIEHGLDINAIDSHGWTPLISCSRIGAVEIVKKLLEFGASTEEETNVRLKYFIP